MLGIVSIVLPFVGFSLIGFVLGLIGASKAKREGRSPLLSRIGWIISLVVLVISALFIALLITAAIVNQNSVNDAAKQAAARSNELSLATGVDANSRKVTTNGFSIVVPKTFTDAPAGYASKDASLTQGDDSSAEYVSVIKESRADFSSTMDVQGYADAVNKSYQNSTTITDATITPLSDVSDPMTYSTSDYEVDGIVSNIKIVYYIRYIETGSNFYQVVTWTTPSKVSEARPELYKILESFTEG